MMIGIATAIKLVPGVFILYLWVTNRRRAAAVAACWFAGVSIASVIALPQASATYWTKLLFDSNRLGDNAGISNQSIRGVLLRTTLLGSAQTALWVAGALVITAIGLRWARTASFQGFEVVAVTIVGLISVLVSPVSWIHHLAGWIPLGIGALVGDGRNLRRVALAVAGTVFFTLRLPWLASAIPGRGQPWQLAGRLTQDSFAIGALALACLLRRVGTQTDASPPAGPIATDHSDYGNDLLTVPAPRRTVS
jgi:alpha-1,2-mannosyltransferase